MTTADFLERPIVVDALFRPHPVPLASASSAQVAERLHERVRKEFWAYAPDEALANDELIGEKYSGIRPAPGSPAC